MRNATAIALALAVLTFTVAPAPAQAQAPPPPTRQTRILGFGVWKAVGCVLAAAAFVAGNAALVLKIRKAGGVVKFAKRLWKAKNKEERLLLIAKVAGTLSGAGAVVKACTP